ncbi:MAG: cation diffusion facilitator family transporter [Myxococcales bacterium]|nr:cation diffusion facilitator family transporter [Myxococcales bacterium]
MDPGSRANAIGLGANAALAVAKFVLGTLTGSTAVVADGFNSAGDIVATAIGWAGYRFGQRPADDNHPFGHGNVESLAGLTIGIILLVTGLFVTIDGVRALARGVTEPPEVLAVGVALGTAALKEGLYRYTTVVGRRLNSPALLASARDHRADVLIAITVAAGVAASQLGIPWIDPLSAVGVGVWIAWMAVEPIRTNLGVLLDEAPADVTEAVAHHIAQQPDVVRVDRVRIHPLGSTYLADVEIAVDPELSLRAAHAIAHRVEEAAKSEIAHLAEVRVHVNPAEP